MPPNRDRHGVTLVETLLVVVLVGLLSAAAYRVFRAGSGYGGRQADASAALTAFTGLCEHLQRDLAGTLPALPQVGDKLWEIRPSAGTATVTYRVDQARGVITRQDAGGKDHPFAFTPTRGRPGTIALQLSPTGDDRTFSLDLRIVPNASFPAEVLERAFPIRYLPSGGSFFGANRPLTAP